MKSQDTITAIATGVGGAIAIVRLSGERAIEICDRVFRPASGIALSQSDGYTLHYGEIVDGSEVIDDVIVSLYRTPRSYSGEDMVEISCHGSTYIQQEIIKLLMRHGARHAEAGEFTVRAFLAGKLDLSQAEAVADIIASTDRATHALATNQMRGGYSEEFSALRDELITLVSLLELELDFSEEDVEFADRAQLVELINKIESKIASLLATFNLGNVIKEGVGVAIVGSPNVGKSTLLNTLLKDDRAMVSDIAGTTRDIIEESINIGGVKFRFIDTAGIRTTDDTLEKMGIERTYNSIKKADIVLYMVDANSPEELHLRDINSLNLRTEQKLCLVINKIDKTSADDYISACHSLLGDTVKVIAISAKSGENIAELVDFLSECVDTSSIYRGSTIVSNSRHYEALLRALESIHRSGEALASDIPADLLSQDIREAIHHIGTITGEITTDDILTSIFSKFCIGK